MRYADDVVVGFEHEGDARRFLEAMRAKLEEFLLSLHPDKTRLIEFGRLAAASRKKCGLGKPETFVHLRKIASRALPASKKTRGDRMRAKLQDIKVELRRRMHWPIPKQGKWLRQIVTGHFAYFAVPTNIRALTAFSYRVIDLWRRTLQRRSQKDGATWERIAQLANNYLPKPCNLHPWPSVRFAVKHSR
ncbi:maturase [Mesorhizobium opportunistum]|uniref:maturase n=1 Tax=Mesorhizobium opportunistum TaxID=593909 RepID=UPI003334E5DA